MNDPGPLRDSFVHLTDLHFWEIVGNPLRLLNKRVIGMANVAFRRRNEFQTQLAEPFAKAVARVGVQSALLTGDFTSTSTEREMEQGARFVESLESQGLKPTAIPGNHDVYTFESVRHGRFERHFKAWMPGEALPCQGTLPHGTPILYVPTVCPNILSSKGVITDEEIRAVSNLLSAVESPVVVAGHYPVLVETHGYRIPPNRQLRNADALREALGRSGKTILYVSGHVHRFSFVQDDAYPNLCHLTTGAFFRRDRASGAEGEFSEIRVYASGYGVVHHVYTGDWQAQAEEKIGL